MSEVYSKTLETILQYCPAEVLEWIPFVIYFISPIPQIITNYKNESTRGVSFYMILLDYAGAVTTTIYTFALWLPLACRVMEPTCLIMISVLWAQSVIYAPDARTRRNSIIMYVLLHVAVVLIVLATLFFRYEIGNLMGWFALYVQLFTQLPQILKNHERQSTKGLSFSYISLYSLAGMLEMVVALILRLPVQTFLYGARAVVYYVILCYQFYIYGDRNPKKRSGVSSL